MTIDLKSKNVNNELVAFCEKKIAELKAKADHNKMESLWSFKIMMLSSLSMPILISYGSDSILWGKILPSILSMLVAFLTSWVQHRKPQQLWRLYRTSQRKLEYELEFYRFGKEKYRNSQDPEEELIIELSKINLDTNEEWAKLVPSEKFTKMS